MSPVSGFCITVTYVAHPPRDRIATTPRHAVTAFIDVSPPLIVNDWHSEMNYFVWRQIWLLLPHALRLACHLITDALQLLNAAVMGFPGDRIPIGVPGRDVVRSAYVDIARVRMLEAGRVHVIRIAAALSQSSIDKKNCNIPSLGF